MARWLIANLAGIILTATIASWGDAQNVSPAEWNRVLAAAKKEGVVAIAGASGNTYREALADRFAKAFPDIHVEYAGMNGRDSVPRIARERRAGAYLWDIFIGGPTLALVGLRPLGAFDPLRLALVRPDVIDDTKWHGGFRDGFMDTEGKLLYAFDGTVNQLIHVNREIVPKGELRSSQELLDPKWAGKIVWEDPRHGGAGLNAAVVFSLSYGEDFLRRLLRDQKIVYTQDRRQMAEWAVRGRYPIVIAMPKDQLIVFQEKGVGRAVEPADSGPIHLMIPGFGATAFMNRAPHPHAAKVYLNWLLSADGQQAWTQITERNSRRLDVPPGDPTLLPDAKQKYINTQKESMTAERNRIMQIAREMLQ